MPVRESAELVRVSEAVGGRLPLVPQLSPQAASQVVTHNTGRGSAQIEMVMSVLETLTDCGLFVFDPQQEDWFPK